MIEGHFVKLQKSQDNLNLINFGLMFIYQNYRILLILYVNPLIYTFGSRVDIQNMLSCSLSYDLRIVSTISTSFNGYLYIIKVYLQVDQLIVEQSSKKIGAHKN